MNTIRIVIEQTRLYIALRKSTVPEYIRDVIKKQPLFAIFSKSLYLFINNVFSSPRNTSIRFFSSSPQSQQNASLSSVSSVLGRRKSQRGPSPLKTVVKAMITVLSRTRIDVCELERYHGAKSMIAFPQFCAFLMDCFAQSAHNFKNS